MVFQHDGCHALSGILYQLKIYLKSKSKVATITMKVSSPQAI